MDNKDAINISMFNADRESEFISYREVINKLAANTGETFCNVAEALKLNRIHLHHAVQVIGPGRTLHSDLEGAKLAALLDDTIRNGAIRIVSIEDTDLDVCGWARDKLIMLLISGGKLPCPTSLTRPWPQPYWIEEFREYESISCYTAAYLLAGVCPYGGSSDLSDEAVAKVDAFAKALAAAASLNRIPLAGLRSSVPQLPDHQGDIRSGLWRYNVLSLTHTGIRAWCKTNGFQWPIPETTEISALEVEIRAWCQANGFQWPTPVMNKVKMPEPARSAAEQNNADVELSHRISEAERDRNEAEPEAALLRAQVSEMQKTIDELRRIVGNDSAAALHNTGLMRIALQVQRDYWRNPAEAPKQEILISELKEKYGLSQFEASAVERVACPIDRKKTSKN